MEPANGEKLDLYSIPVFILELLILGALSWAAYFLHFQYEHKPNLSGFYCDDISLRHEYRESKLTEQFTRPDNEAVVLALLLVVPIFVIIFCELVNSMFGSLKFRKVRSLCRCCKLHSITRRTVRFAGAYIFGFLVVMISCNMIANLTGQLKPYFAQECPQAFKGCPVRTTPSSSAGGALQPLGPQPSTAPLGMFEGSDSSTNNNNNNQQGGSAVPNQRPPSAPIMHSNSTNPVADLVPARLVRNRRDSYGAAASSGRRLVERQWVFLDGVSLAELCEFSGDEIQTRKFDQLAMSWPSFPASIVTYACLFVATYLCFVGTARPFRMVSSVLVMVILIGATMFNVQLVKEHFSHWEDALAGSLLAFVVVIFVLLVYVNKFRDSHYYKNQKLLQRAYLNGSVNQYNGYSNEIALEQFNQDKTDEPMAGAQAGGRNAGSGGSIPNNDLAMRYFQIPRANYSGSR